MTFMDERKGLSNVYIYILYIIIESFKNRKLVANPVQFQYNRWLCQKTQAVCQAKVDPGVPNKNGQSRTTCELKIASGTSEPQRMKRAMNIDGMIPSGND